MDGDNANCNWGTDSRSRSQDTIVSDGSTSQIAPPRLHSAAISRTEEDISTDFDANPCSQ